MPGAAIFRTLAGILSAPVALDVSSVRRALKTSASFNFRNVKYFTSPNYIIGGAKFD